MSLFCSFLAGYGWFSSLYFNDWIHSCPKWICLNSGELSPIQNFPLESTSRKYLEKPLFTSEIPPGLVISFPLTDLENWSLLLFPRTVYCNTLRPSLSAHLNNTSNSFWTWEPGNPWTRKHDRSTLTYCRFFFIVCVQQSSVSVSKSKFTFIKSWK